MKTEKILTQINGTPIRRNFVEDLPYNPSLKKLLPGKRRAGILSEVLFWKRVRDRQFYGIDFDRQRIIGNYIVDFYVKTLGLVVEIDGQSHEQKDEYDSVRSDYIESLGLQIFRVTDLEVKTALPQVMQSLEDFIVQKFGI